MVVEEFREGSDVSNNRRIPPVRKIKLKPPPKAPDCSDAATAFKLTRRFEMYRLLMGKPPRRRLVTDNMLRGAKRAYIAKHGRDEYAKRHLEASLAGYRAMFEKVKQQRTAREAQAEKKNPQLDSKRRAAGN